jgi:glycosyltransferase involved in cell wall biosynthesis
MQPVSAYMLTFNNAPTVERALASVAFTDELVVVDSGSTDGTLELVRAATDRVIERPWPGFREQYQFAQNQCSHDWVLFIDADEEISPPLADEIQTLLGGVSADDSVRGYNVDRRTFYLGRWILHGAWARDFEIRLYNRQHSRWEGGLHAAVEVDGDVGSLRHFYHHYTHEDIGDQLRTIDRYSTIGAADLEQQGCRCSLVRLIGNPLLGFVRDYVLRRGFLDGFPGLVIAVNTAFSTFNKYAKLRERRLTEDDVRKGFDRKPE